MINKNTKKIIVRFSVCCIVLTFLLIVASFFTGCSEAYSEAARVNANVSQQARYFECCRKITVVNARTDKVMFEMEGYMNIENNLNDELVVTFKTGPDTYKVNYVYLNEWTLYVVEDITGTVTDPYHYKVYFHTNILPDIEVKP
jgi:hypothetical protein